MDKKTSPSLQARRKRTPVDKRYPYRPYTSNVLKLIVHVLCNLLKKRRSTLLSAYGDNMLERRERPSLLVIAYRDMVDTSHG